MKSTIKRSLLALCSIIFVFAASGITASAKAKDQTEKVDAVSGKSAPWTWPSSSTKKARAQTNPVPKKAPARKTAKSGARQPGNLPAKLELATPPASPATESECGDGGARFDISRLAAHLVGNTEIDLGFAQVPIQRNVVVGTNPGCAPIELDPLTSRLFDGPLSTPAAAVFLDQIFGSNPNHQLHFFCRAERSAPQCVPCGNPLEACDR